VPLPEMATGILEVVKAGYVKLTRPFNTRNTRLRKVENDFRLFKLEKGTVVRLDNIYYDYGMSDIRADAAFELDKLVQILNDNPTMRIELSSHTDSRGGDAFNLKLSDARAQSAVKYVISRGIDASRLVAKGYGETKLLNNCANNVNCSEEEHQFNRRTEFMILDI
jgi:outer membrane protein OmpA-like peptidoglycan-associated protein